MIFDLEKTIESLDNIKKEVEVLERCLVAKSTETSFEITVWRKRLEDVSMVYKCINLSKSYIKRGAEYATKS